MVGVAVLGKAMAAGWTPPGGVGLPLAVLLLLGCECGLPIPVPADVLMVAIGAAVSAGTLPWWLATLVVEAIAIAGTTLLVLAASGPAAAVTARLGARIGLSPGRLARATRLIEQRGLLALVLGRTTPGLRTITVVATGAAQVPRRRALPALILGSSIFLQGHLILGLALGTPLRGALQSSRGRVALVPLVLVVAGVGVILARRGRFPRRAWADGVCPVCLATACAYPAGPARAETAGIVLDPRTDREMRPKAKHDAAETSK